MRNIGRLGWRLVGLRAVASGLCVAAAGCDLLPSDGPNTNGMLAHASVNLKANPNAAVMRFAIVGIDARIAQAAEQYYQPTTPNVPRTFLGSGNFGAAGVGDVLRVTIWEAGEGLFGKDRRGADMTVRVDVDGTISLPYAGRFRVAGRRLSDVEAMIVSKLEGQAVQPQATVLFAENISNAVSVQGDVNKPGPVPVARTNQRILDVVAMAGGAKYPPYETAVRLTRGRSTMNVSMQEVIDQPEPFNVSVAAGDALLLSRSPQKFLALGAVAQPGEQIFRKSPLTLSDGLGQVLGLDPQRSDAKGVYLFRREPVELARRYGVQPLAEDRDTVPIVYQLDLKDPKSFFVMSNFPVRPNDIVFVSAAPLAEAARFFQILSGATGTVAIPRTLLGNYPSGS
ncbi:MAG: polysaccharide biosynthesis/export family protein [Reyranella sp.]|uniref:polysaccharide biosynthesis/export family protein n=1 Tax=Reyranella sp. TaxID=1929291 RepID=UPI0027310207|nr:polysaccharide biosynthesis/export family protein [Reyranella sp.]MDP1961147.1 polysaccharide biosynthesis/export family protein [Reyranella sp.]MDP2376429.1 polysaccharide biosynthesis/export family protein [Reyranella sp.]